MKKVILFIFLAALSAAVNGQSTVLIRGDSVKIYKQGGNGELILENGTRSRTGAYLKNSTNGRTIFSYAVDSMSISGSTITVWRGGGTQNITIGIPASATRFAVAGEDATATGLRYFDAAGHSFNIDSLSVVSSGNGFATKVSASFGTRSEIKLGNTDAFLRTYNHFLSKFAYIGTSDRTAQMSITGLNGSSAIYVQDDASFSRILITPPLGNLIIDTLNSGASTDSVMTWNAATGGVRKRDVAAISTAQKFALDDISAAATRSFDGNKFNFSFTDMGITTISQTAQAAVSGANGTANVSPITVTGGAGGATSFSTGTVSAGNAGTLQFNGGTGGAITGTPTTGIGGAGGSIDMTAGNGGAGTTFGGNGGTVNFQGGDAGTGTTGGTPGYASIKGGSAGISTNGGGASIFLSPGAKDGSGTDGEVFLGVSPSSTVRGNVTIGSATPGGQKLNVTGSIRMVDGNEAAGRVMTSDANGVATWQAAAAGGANTALSNLASVAINTALLPGTTNSISLGSSTKQWNSIYLPSSSTEGIRFGGVNEIWSDGGAMNFRPATGIVQLYSAAGIVFKLFDAGGSARAELNSIGLQTTGGQTTWVLQGGGGNVGIAVTPTARLHIIAGTTAAGTAPLKIDEGSDLTTPADGAIEHTADNLKFTAGSTRYTLAKTLTATATLDFGNTLAGTVTDLTITVTGAADGDVVTIGVPNGSYPATGTFTAWVSAANTVTVRYANNSLTLSQDPASGTFRASVIKY